MRTVLLTLIALNVHAESYPLQMIQRPFTMPQNSFESSIQFENSTVGVLSADYGITDDFQLGLSWSGMSSTNLDPATYISLNAGYSTFDNRWVANMVTASIPLYFEPNVLGSFTFSATTLFFIIPEQLGLYLFYEDWVVLNWTDAFVMQFNFPLRFSWQATEQSYLTLGTHLATLSTDGNHNHIGNTTPLVFEGLYAVTQFVDIFGTFGFKDVQQPTDIVMVLGVAFRGGALTSIPQT